MTSGATLFIHYSKRPCWFKSKQTYLRNFDRNSPVSRWLLCVRIKLLSHICSQDFQIPLFTTQLKKPTAINKGYFK